MSEGQRLSSSGAEKLQISSSWGFCMQESPLHPLPLYERPEEQINLDAWNYLSSDIGLQQKVAQKALEASSPPKGFDAEVWKLLSWADKKAILSLQPKKISPTIFGYDIKDSNVLLFFADVTGDNFNFDAGVNSMALICALILTIPFGLMGTLDQDHWSAVSDQIADCPGGSLRGYSFEDFFYETMNNIVCVIYSAMSGLVLSTLYYVFKPKDDMNMPKWKIIKQRLLIFLLFVSTITSVVGLLNATTDFLTLFTVAEVAFCKPPLSRVWPFGVGFVTFAFVLGMILMW